MLVELLNENANDIHFLKTFLAKLSKKDDQGQYAVTTDQLKEIWDMLRDVHKNPNQFKQPKKTAGQFGPRRTSGVARNRRQDISQTNMDVQQPQAGPNG